MSRYAGSTNNNIKNTMSPAELKSWLKEIEAQYAQRLQKGRDRMTPEKCHEYYLKRKALRGRPISAREAKKLTRI